MRKKTIISLVAVHLGLAYVLACTDFPTTPAQPDPGEELAEVLNSLRTTGITLTQLPTIRASMGRAEVPFGLMFAVDGELLEELQIVAPQELVDELQIVVPRKNRRASFILLDQPGAGMLSPPKVMQDDGPDCVLDLTESMTEQEAADWLACVRNLSEECEDQEDRLVLRATGEYDDDGNALYDITAILTYCMDEDEGGTH